MSKRKRETETLILDRNAKEEDKNENEARKNNQKRLEKKKKVEEEHKVLMRNLSYLIENQIHPLKFDELEHKFTVNKKGAVNRSLVGHYPTVETIFSHVFPVKFWELLEKKVNNN